MLELLSTYNQVIWANPYGKITGALLPRITTLKEGLTIYNPGVDLLPIPSLKNLNEKRRLMQLNFYLLEKDFEPDLVWIDDPAAALFTAAYGKKGALTLYYALEDIDSQPTREKRAKLAGAVDLIVTPSPVLYKKYSEHPARVFLLSGGDLGQPPEIEDEEPAEDQLEKAFMDALQVRLEELSAIVKKELVRKGR